MFGRFRRDRGDSHVTPSSVLEPLRAYWRGQGLPLQCYDEAAMARYDALVARHRDARSSTLEPHRDPLGLYRALLMGGIALDEDERGYRWRAIDELVVHSVADEHWLVFCDYFQESFWYCVRLTGDWAGCVSLLPNNEPGMRPDPAHRHVRRARPTVHRGVPTLVRRGRHVAERRSLTPSSLHIDGVVGDDSARRTPLIDEQQAQEIVLAT